MGYRGKTKPRPRGGEGLEARAVPCTFGSLVLGTVLDWIKDKGNQKSGEDGAVTQTTNAPGRLWTVPELTSVCPRAKEAAGCSDWAPGAQPGQLVNGVVTERKAGSVGSEGVGACGVGAGQGLDGAPELQC